MLLVDSHQPASRTQKDRQTDATCRLDHSERQRAKVGTPTPPHPRPCEGSEVSEAKRGAEVQGRGRADSARVLVQTGLPPRPSWSQVAGVGGGSQAESREPPLISELLEA